MLKNSQPNPLPKAWPNIRACFGTSLLANKYFSTHSEMSCYFWLYEEKDLFLKNCTHINSDFWLAHCICYDQQESKSFLSFTLISFKSMFNIAHTQKGCLNFYFACACRVYVNKEWILFHVWITQTYLIGKERTLTKALVIFNVSSKNFCAEVEKRRVSYATEYSNHYFSWYFGGEKKSWQKNNLLLLAMQVRTESIILQHKFHSIDLY